MQAFARDVQLTAVAEMTSGEKLTALEIQRRLLQRAEDACGSRGMPAWAEACCQQWRAILDQLARGPEAVERTLDWAMKLSLFRRHAERRGMPWQRLMQWQAVSRITAGDTPPSAEARSAFSFPPFRVGRSTNSSPTGIEELPALLEQRGLPLEELELVEQIRQELFELDVRFGQFDERGLFNRWEQSGGLDHGVPGVERIEEAKSAAPAGGRAQIRGRLVAQLSASGARASCDWHGVWDLDRQSYVDLSHPYETREVWQPCSDLDMVRQEAPDMRVYEALRRGVTAYDGGDYRTAERWLALARELVGHFAQGPVADVMRFTAWTRARSGIRTAIDISP